MELIISKRQLINLQVNKLFKDEIPVKFLKLVLSKPEIEFIADIKNTYNLTLEPIRKNLYIARY